MAETRDQGPKPFVVDIEKETPPITRHSAPHCGPENISRSP